MTRQRIIANVYSRSAISDMISALRDARLEASLSQSEIDHAARLRPGSCARLESEIETPSKKRSLPTGDLERIARLLGVRFRPTFSDRQEPLKR